MTEISTLNQTQPTNQTNAKKEKQASGLASDYETFLKMLTTQMTNQDPLNPVDSADYAVQLATFSSVEQQVRTNELLSQMIGRDGGPSFLDQAMLVSKDAATLAPKSFDGQPIKVVVSLPGETQSAILRVKDQAGNIVHSFTVDPSKHSTSWDGKLQNGQTAPAGPYSFTVEGYVEDKLSHSAAAPAYARIEEVRKSDKGIMFYLENGARVLAEDVVGID